MPLDPVLDTDTLPQGRVKINAGFGVADSAQSDASQALADAAVADGKAVAAQGDATQALADAAAAQSTADAAIPSSEKGAADGVATLDAAGHVPIAQQERSLDTLEARAQFAHIRVPAAAVIAWDDFVEPSAELHGRVSPSGHTWRVQDLEGTTFLGEWSVADGRAAKTSTTTGSIGAQLLVSGSMNGRVVEGIFLKPSAPASRVQLSFHHEDGDSVILSITSGNLQLSKNVDGVSTTLIDKDNDGYPAGTPSRHYSNISLGFAISASAASMLFSTEGAADNFEVADEDVRKVLTECIAIGFSGSRSAGSYGLRIVGQL